MNQKSAKLIKKYAVKTGGKYRALKAEWDRLTADQRRRRRAAYRTVLKATT